ncbi:hypothetical protein MTR_7g024590 [Medicago truncatula]|uniref:Uncharacterized protein n=1 Tax=Medicago truncatula TaxID=3880 RepID=G7KXU0_MEDTR|nr:hypothetical protein MTR_7g024590 [Medicago truncatula]
MKLVFALQSDANNQSKELRAFTRKVPRQRESTRLSGIQLVNRLVILPGLSRGLEEGVFTRHAVDLEMNSSAVPSAVVTLGLIVGLFQASGSKSLVF